jgi:hypothetical protein
MSIATDLAKAVAAELNRHEFSMPFEAAYSVRGSFELAKLDTLHVAVVPKELEIDSISRCSSKYSASIDIGISQRIGDRTPEEAVEVFGALVDEIADFIKETTLENFPAALCQGIRFEPLFIPDHLHGQRIFTSVLNVKYIMRD